MIPECQPREVGDDTDRAQGRAEEFLADALAEFERAHPHHETPPESEWPTHCWACELPIPEKRRQAVPGVGTCIDCQQDIEDLDRKQK